jgi:SAM-dependent methyltransferase
MTIEEAHEVYDASAESYAETNPHVEPREAYEWPMVRRLLPDIDGLGVLDAGTGPGYYAAILAEEGADVVGVDASEAMVATARERHGDVATFRQADLTEPLPFDDARFDLVVSQLALDHVRDWDRVGAEFARVLADGGRLVASTDHPFNTYFVIEHEPPEIGSADAQSADYYAVERFERNWGDEDDPHWIPFYRRPLRAVLRPLFEAGFLLEDLLEPPPETDEELLGYFDEETPRFLGLRARLPPGER